MADDDLPPTLEDVIKKMRGIEILVMVVIAMLAFLMAMVGAR